MGGKLACDATTPLTDAALPPQGVTVSRCRRDARSALLRGLHARGEEAQVVVVARRLEGDRHGRAEAPVALRDHGNDLNGQNQGLITVKYRI